MTAAASVTVTALQGSQPTLGALRIGVMDAATQAGVSKARLLLRPASGDRIVVLAVGDEIRIDDHGTLRLDAVANTHDRADTSIHPEVTLTLSPA